MAYSVSDRKYLKTENFGKLIGTGTTRFKTVSNKFFKRENRDNSNNMKSLSPISTKMVVSNAIIDINDTLNVEYSKTGNIPQHKTVYSAPANKMIFNSNNISDSSFNNSSYNISAISSDITKNSAEKGLRGYFTLNKAHFIERVSKGAPDTFRWVSWLIISGVPFTRCSDMYSSILEQDLDSETEIQINKDITRTLRDQDLNSPEIQSMLYRILKVLALLDKDLSYCQGMNFISGYLLITSDFDELETLFLLIYLFSHNSSQNFGFRNLFTHGFPLLMFYLYAFDVYFSKKLPILNTHFKLLEIPTECWVSKWFQTIFTHCLTYEAVLRLWDYILIHGLSFIIPFTLSLLKHLEKQLLLLNDLVEVTEFFKRLNTYHYKLNQKLQIEFNIESILKDAKGKFYVSKDELNILLLNDYYKKKHFECLESKEIIPYIICEKKYMIKNFWEGDNKNISQNLNEINIKMDTHSSNKCQNNKNTTAFTIRKENTGISKISGLEKEEINIEIEDDIVVNELGIIDSNRKILEVIHNNTNSIKFENPFFKNTNNNFNNEK